MGILAMELSWIGKCKNLNYPCWSCSDKPGEHNFELLRKLVLPDGSILRALFPGQPTWDCLFVDPNHDGKRYMAQFCRVKYNLSSLSSKLNGIKDVDLAGLMAICFWQLVCCSLLKIWNMNKYTGVLGVFNCQGASWSQEEKINYASWWKSKKDFREHSSTKCAFVSRGSSRWLGRLMCSLLS